MLDIAKLTIFKCISSLEYLLLYLLRKFLWPNSFVSFAHTESKWWPRMFYISNYNESHTLTHSEIIYGLSNDPEESNLQCAFWIIKGKLIVCIMFPNK